MEFRMNFYLGTFDSQVRVCFLEHAPSLLKGGMLHYMGCIASAATKVCQVKVDDGGEGLRHTIYPMTMEDGLVREGLMVSTCGPAMVVCLLADDEAIIGQIELNDTTGLIVEQLHDIEGKERLEITKCRQIIQRAEAVGRELREDRAIAVQLGHIHPEDLVVNSKRSADD